MEPLNWEACAADYFCLTGEGMKSYLRNQAEIIRWMREASARMLYFKQAALPAPTE